MHVYVIKMYERHNSGTSIIVAQALEGGNWRPFYNFILSLVSSIWNRSAAKSSHKNFVNINNSLSTACKTINLQVSSVLLTDTRAGKIEGYYTGPENFLALCDKGSTLEVIKVAIFS